jgi:hypothetical protein
VRTNADEGLHPGQVEGVERLLVGHIVEDVEEVPGARRGRARWRVRDQ